MSGKRKWFYDSVDDSNRRLRSSVVMYQNQPVLIERVAGLNTDQVANFYRLPLGKAPIVEQAPLNAQNFRIKDLPSLGYVDHKKYSYYVSRVSSRQNIQGISRHNTIIQANPEGGAPNLDGLTLISSFVDMLNNKYPQFRNVFEEVISSDDPIKRAFTKTFAISIDDMETVDLEHRGMKVARAVNPKKLGPVFKLPKKFHYLSEELEENGLRVEA